MQQKEFICQKVVKTIRDAIRAGAKPLNKAGSMCIALVPYTKEADLLLGGYSELNDYVTYSYEYSLNPSLEIMTCDVSSRVTISIKRRRLFSHHEFEGAVYAWDDFFDMNVRVCGDETKNKALAKLAFDAVKPFFSEEFSVTLAE